MTSLDKSHMTLQAEHTALAKSHTTLQSEHAALVAQNAALAKCHTALQAEHAEMQRKVHDVASVMIQHHMQSSSQMAKIYQILVDTSSLTLNGSQLTLSLSNCIGQSGHHYIILSQKPPQPDYKFKLEWKRTAARPSTQLSLIQVINDDYPPMTEDTKFDVAIVNCKSNGTPLNSHSSGAQTLSICCGKSAEVSGATSLQLIGTIDFEGAFQVKLQLRHHDRQKCPCPCHPYVCAQQTAPSHFYNCPQCGRQYRTMDQPYICRRCNAECQHNCQKH